ncbi:MAG: hypothetical protein HDR17_14475 [Lachnospiraceae bacterium]|nr:hypothetical protein [Lachnospiraceae bacterium]
MKKSNINGVVSYNQYKLVDILLFMVIMAALEAVNVFAIKRWFPDMLFAVSLMFTVSLIVLVRWNFIAAIFPVLHGVLYCAFLSVFQTVGYEEYIIYAVGNSFLLLSWFIFKLIPKEKLFSKWYLTLIYPAVAFVLVLLGRTLVAMCFGTGFVEALGSYFFTESLNIVFAIIALLILRRVDGMLEDQKTYLKRVAREKTEAKTQKDEVWAGYTELDEDELKKLHDYSVKEEKGDGIDLRDEYPPDSR